MKKTPIKEFQNGDKLVYVGKGFLGFDPADTEMIFISKDGFADAYVIYKGNRMLVRLHEIELTA